MHNTRIKKQQQFDHILILVQIFSLNSETWFFFSRVRELDKHWYVACLVVLKRFLQGKMHSFKLIECRSAFLRQSFFSFREYWLIYLIIWIYSKNNSSCSTVDKWNEEFLTVCSIFSPSINLLFYFSWEKIHWKLFQSKQISHNNLSVRWNNPNIFYERNGRWQERRIFESNWRETK